MTETLLTSETFVKGVLAISDNIDGKYMLPAIREAQEVELRKIWGADLLEKVKALVKNGTISQVANSTYKALVDLPFTQYFLAYTAGCKVQPKVAFKIGNFGVTKTTDEHLQSVSMQELSFTMKEYQNNADDNCKNMQEWIRKNCQGLPELVGSELFSAASTGIWLGGKRGKMIRK